MDSLRLLKQPAAREAIQPLLNAVDRMERAATKGEVTLSSHDFEILEAFQFFKERMEVIRKKHPPKRSEDSGQFPSTDLLTINS